jgi:hypothetical protein
MRFLNMCILASISVEQDVIIPIVIGILTSAIIFLSQQLFSHVFMPWYRKQTYRGLILEGNWESQFVAKYDASVTCRESAAMRQHATDINGDISYVEQGADKKIIKQKSFRFIGRYIDGVLVATYVNTDPRQLGMGSFTLKIQDEGRRLVGKYSWLDPETGNVEADQYEWTRKS